MYHTALERIAVCILLCFKRGSFLSRAGIIAEAALLSLYISRLG